MTDTTSTDVPIDTPDVSLFEKLKYYSQEQGGEYTKADFEQYLFWKDNLNILDNLAERAFHKSFSQGGETEVNALKRLGQYDFCFSIKQAIKITKIAVAEIYKIEDRKKEK